MSNLIYCNWLFQFRKSLSQPANQHLVCMSLVAIENVEFLFSTRSFQRMTNFLFCRLLDAVRSSTGHSYTSPSKWSRSGFQFEIVVLFIILLLCLCDDPKLYVVVHNFLADRQWNLNGWYQNIQPKIDISLFYLHFLSNFLRHVENEIIDWNGWTQITIAINSRSRHYF